MTEITLAEETIESLRQDAEKYKLFFEDAPLGYQTLDEKGNFIEVNETWCKLLGYDKKEVIGRNFSEFIHPEFKSHFENCLDQFKRLGYILGTEFEMIKKDKSVIIISANGKIAQNDDGSFRQTHCILKDITKQKHAEEAFRKSENEYQQLFHSMTNGFAVHELVCDESGNPIDYKFLQINPAFEKLTGLRAVDLIGKKAYESLPGLEDFWLEKYSRVALTGEPVHFENYSISLDKFFDVTAYSSAKNQFACIFSNVTSRKKTEEELKIAYEQLVMEQVELRKKNKTIKKAEIDLRSAYEKLITEQVALRTKNIALKEVLGQIESKKRQLQIQIQNNVERIIKPILRNLEPKIDLSDKQYVKLLENSLDDVTKPFTNRFEINYSKFSPRELEVCNMIKNGMSSKDIASALNTSVYTVHNQRRSIRKKLEINDNKTNLLTLLQSN